MRKSDSALPLSAISLEIPKLLKRMRQNAGLSQAELGRLMDLDQSQISDRETGKTAMSVEDAYRACEVMERPIEELLPGRPQDAPRPRLNRREASVQHQWPAQFLPDFIPIRTDLRKTVPPVDWVPRPPALINVSDAYALYMIGSSMLPRFRPGQRLYINPHRPPSRGIGVLVVNRENGHMIGQYLEETGECIKAEQLNPARILEIHRSTIAAIHTIIGLDEF